VGTLVGRWQGTVTDAQSNLASYRRLRSAIGVIGFLLFLVPLAYSIATGDWHESISYYYYTPVRDFFLGALCSLGVFLVFYLGYDGLDTAITDFAGVCAIGIALDPTKENGTRETWQNYLHPVFAAIAFVLLATMSLQFTQKGNEPSGIKASFRRLACASLFQFYDYKHMSEGGQPRKRSATREDRVYVVCAWAIILFLLVTAAVDLSHTDKYFPLIVSECIMLFFFSFSWAVKGGTLPVVRKLRQHELDTATGQVIASATLAIILVQRDLAARSVSPALSARKTLGTESEWADKITRAIERLQIADQVIQRYGQRYVAEASSRVISTATEYARGGRAFPDVDDAIASFTRVLHK
jgi:hypothetical protein